MVERLVFPKTKGKGTGSLPCLLWTIAVSMKWKLPTQAF